MPGLLSGRDRASAAARWGPVVLLLAVGCAHSVRPERPREEGEASWYGPGLYGKKTASGEVLRPGTLTAAHRTLPFGTCLRVTNLENGRVVEVRVNDRGPYAAGRILDVSETAARALGMVGRGSPASGSTPARVTSLDSPTPSSRPACVGRPGGAQSTSPRDARRPRQLDADALAGRRATGGAGAARGGAARSAAKMSDLLAGRAARAARRGRADAGRRRGVRGRPRPGSFTGLRIGLATVKGLAYARRLPVAGASSLAALALEGPEDVPLAAVAVARRGELYLGRYRRTGDARGGARPRGGLHRGGARAMARLRAGGPGARTGGARGRPKRSVAAGRTRTRCSPTPDVPSAWAVARLAGVPAAFDLQALSALEPHYVRASEAERNPKFPPLPGPAPAARIRGEES